MPASAWKCMYGCSLYVSVPPKKSKVSPSFSSSGGVRERTWLCQSSHWAVRLVCWLSRPVSISGPDSIFIWSVARVADSPPNPAIAELPLAWPPPIPVYLFISPRSAITLLSHLPLIFLFHLSPSSHHPKPGNHSSSSFFFPPPLLSCTVMESFSRVVRTFTSQWVME